MSEEQQQAIQHWASVPGFKVSTDTEEESETPKVSLEDMPEATFEDILAEYEQEEGEFAYVVGEGKRARRYVGKRLANFSEKIALNEEADAFLERYEKIRKAPVEKVPLAFRAWKEFAIKPMNKKAAVLILYITKLLVTPTLSQLQCLRLHHKGGNALMQIGGPLLTAGVEEAYEEESEAIEDAKND